MNKSNNEAVLVVLCKRPRLGVGKQRLAESIGIEPAYKTAEALFDCAMEDAAAWPGVVVLSPAEQGDIGWAEEAALKSQLAIWEAVAQSEGNLGERINTLDEQLRSRGYEKILYMGTDAPMLQESHYQQSLQALERADIVLSPAEDGGLVLMGNRRPWPALQSLAWSTDQLGHQVAGACAAAGQVIEPIQPGFDIDIESDLLRFFHEYQADSREARQRLIGVIGQVLDIQE